MLATPTPYGAVDPKGGDMESILRLLQSITKLFKRR